MRLEAEPHTARQDSREGPQGTAGKDWPCPEKAWALAWLTEVNSKAWTVLTGELSILFGPMRKHAGPCKPSPGPLPRHLPKPSLLLLWWKHSAPESGTPATRSPQALLQEAAWQTDDQQICLIPSKCDSFCLAKPFINLCYCGQYTSVKVHNTISCQENVIQTTVW